MADFVGKKVLAGRISKASGVPREDVEKVLDALGPAVARSLAEGKETRIPGLARFFPPSAQEGGGESGSAPSAVVDPSLLAEATPPAEPAPAPEAPAEPAPEPAAPPAPEPSPEPSPEPPAPEGAAVPEAPAPRKKLKKKNPAEPEGSDPASGSVAGATAGDGSGAEAPPAEPPEPAGAPPGPECPPALDDEATMIGLEPIAGPAGAAAEPAPEPAPVPAPAPSRGAADDLETVTGAAAGDPEREPDRPEIPAPPEPETAPEGPPGPSGTDAAEASPAGKRVGEGIPSIVALLDPETAAQAAGVLQALEREGVCRALFASSPAEAGALLVRLSGGVLLVGPKVTQREYHGLAAALKLHPERGNGHIVRIVPAGANPFSEDRMTIIPDEVVDSPVQAESLEETLRAELLQTEEEGGLYLRQMAIRIPSREEMTEQVVEVIERISETTRLGERKRAELMPAIREALGAAIRVGNAGDPSRFVDVSCLVDEEKFAVVVKHEGRTTPEALAEAESGFSSLIMKKGADEVEPLPPGNRIMLTKYF
ncbi:MAG: ATP-binding protein [Planctomycetes bacterium]|jgi:anti-sigma regulatory factor (Ser/Thr protein kinase)|nr:ATP-binding protein [Planctomycetota bacterium]